MAKVFICSNVVRKEIEINWEKSSILTLWAKWGKSRGGKVQSIYKRLPLPQLWNFLVWTVGRKREILPTLFVTKIPILVQGAFLPCKWAEKLLKTPTSLVPWAATWKQLGCLALGSNCFPGRDRRPEVGNVISGVGSAQLERPERPIAF